MIATSLSGGGVSKVVSETLREKIARSVEFRLLLNRNIAFSSTSTGTSQKPGSLPLVAIFFQNFPLKLS